MSVQTMMPAQSGTSSLDGQGGLLGAAGSSASMYGAPSSMASALIEALVQTFEEMMGGQSGGTLGGAGAAQDSTDALPFDDGSSGDLGGTEDGGELGSESNTDPRNTSSASADLSSAGPNAAPNLSAELAQLFSQSYNPGSGASSSPAPADNQGGTQSGSSFNQSAPASGADQVAPSPFIPASSAESSGDSSSAGQASSIDGATAGPDTVDFKLENTGSQNETIALTNAQGQKFDQESLKPGQSADVLLSANDPNTKSMREELENSDGSLRSTDVKIGESNIQDVGGHAVVSNDISNNNFSGTSGTDGKNVSGTQMKFTDGKGLEEGDDTANRAYQYSTDDTNAMKMAMDTSQNYTFAASS